MTKYISKLHGKKRALIEHEEGVGFYLYIYSLETGECINDYLEDNLSEAQQRAQEEFNIIISSWEKL